MTGPSLPVPAPYAATDDEAFLPRSIIDPKGGRDRGRRLLVVSTVDDAAGKLGGYTKPVDTIKVVVPAVRQGWLDWLANDQEAFAHADDLAAETAAALPGRSAGSTAGEADIALAIRDALATFRADEIVVAIRGDEDAGFVESLGVTNAERGAVDGIPVRYIVVDGA